MRTIIIFIFFSFHINFALSQETQTDKQQLIGIGLSSNIFSSGETLYYWPNKGILRTKLGFASELKLTLQSSITENLIYKISFPLINSSQTIDFQEISFGTGPDFSLTYLFNSPTKVFPYVEIAFSSLIYTHKNGYLPNESGPKITRINVPLKVGFRLFIKKNNLDFSVNYHAFKDFYYFGSSFASFHTTVSKANVALAYSYNINYKKNKNIKLDAKIGKGLFISSSLVINNWIKRSNYNQEDKTRRFISKYNFSPSPEFILGINKNTWSIGLKYRKDKSTTEAYDVKQKISRNLVGLDFRKTLTINEHFSSFIGTAISYATMHFDETYFGMAFNTKKRNVSFNGKIGFNYLPFESDNFSISSNIGFTPKSPFIISEGKSLNLTSIEFTVIELTFKL